MAHQAIYRKWRPTVFEDIVGQGHITRTLRNQVMNNRIGHAYLFCGTRGTGKTTCAKVFSRAVNCLDPHEGSPCNKCPVCLGILDGSIMDVTEIDAASNNGVDNIREIREDVQYVSTAAKYTVYIIDEVHMLSGGAFNALLKTLEEPPKNVIFILATTEAHKLPQTILSRCQRFDFKRIQSSDIIIRMKEIARGENLQITEDAYRLLASLADGSMRDGLSVLERVASSSNGEITADIITEVLGISKDEQLMSITDALADNDINKILGIVEEILSDGKDLKVFNESLIAHFRDLLVLKVSNDDNILEKPADIAVKLRSQCDRLSFEKISDAIKVLTAAQADAKWVKAPRVIFELAYIKLARPEINSSPDALLDRLSAIENKINAGLPAKSAAVPPDIEKRLERLESKMQNAGGTISVPEEAPQKEVQKKAPLRLYSPIPPEELNTANPIIKHARNWDNLARIILTDAPMLFPALNNIPITADNDGIILLYKRSEQSFLYDLAVKHKDEIAERFRKASQSEFTVKTAYLEDIEDSIIDIWSVPSKDEDIPSPDKDPLDTLSEEFAGIAENMDDAEFLNYDSSSEDFTQSTIDTSTQRVNAAVENPSAEDENEDDEEEFLTDDEMPSEDEEQ